MNSLSKNFGLENLQRLVAALPAVGPLTGQHPIVFVPGYSGWGSPLFGAFNYWGGSTDIAAHLAALGYAVIVTSPGPFSSNWERACEVYAQLMAVGAGVFNMPGLPMPLKMIAVDYGNHCVNCIAASAPPPQLNRRAAILYGNLPPGWTWNRIDNVHFICHSQGGNTARYLIELLMNGNPLHPGYFNIPGRDDYIRSVVTLATPHRGTTVTDVVINFTVGFITPLTQLMATASFEGPPNRVFDLQLDHWGICRNGPETYADMLNRLTMGSVPNWLSSGHHGFQDNSMPGVATLPGMPSPNIYYFTMSFNAVESCTPLGINVLTAAEIAAFPLPLFPLLQNVISMVPGGTALLNALLSLTSYFVNANGLLLSQILLRYPQLAAWGIGIFNRYLTTWNPTIQIPAPRNHRPRGDVLPFLMPTAYAIASYTPPGGFPAGANWHLNDGIVNTESMSGPANVAVLPIAQFPGIAAPGSRGTYWHFGINNTMDHADAIGIWVNPLTSADIQAMYVDIAALLSRL